MKNFLYGLFASLFLVGAALAGDSPLISGTPVYEISRDRPGVWEIEYELVFDSRWERYYGAGGGTNGVLQTKWKQGYDLDRSTGTPLSFWYREPLNTGNFWALQARALDHGGTGGWELQSYRGQRGWILTPPFRDDKYLLDTDEPFPNDKLVHILLANHDLRLKARPALTNIGGINEKTTLGQDYVSGMLNSAKRLEAAYGYWEVRMAMGKAAAGKNLKGGFPAIWFVSSELTGAGSPHEWGMFECLDMDDPIAKSHLYLLQRDGQPSTGNEIIGYDTIGNIDPTQKHTYGFEWTPDTMAWFIDGQLVYERPSYHDLRSYIIINLAIWDSDPSAPGSTPTAPDANTDFDNMYLDIEYIKFFKSKYTIKLINLIDNPEVQ